MASPNRRMIRQIALTTAACACLTGPVQAGDEDGRYAVEGPGRLSCGDFNALPPSDAVRRDLAVWLTGYFTAHNRLLPKTFDLTPWQTPATVLAMVAQYCEAHPDRIAERAAQELVSHLAELRIQAEAPVLMQRAGDQVTVLYEEVVKSATAALGAAGFAVGPSEDGFAQAVRRFQKNNGLPETGTLDQATLALLLQ
jgi:hypothetical protein